MVWKQCCPGTITDTYSVKTVLSSHSHRYSGNTVTVSTQSQQPFQAAMLSSFVGQLCSKLVCLVSLVNVSVTRSGTDSPQSTRAYPLLNNLSRRQFFYQVNPLCESKSTQNTKPTPKKIKTNIKRNYNTQNVYLLTIKVLPSASSSRHDTQHRDTHTL